jgi:hypothetical protein
MGQRTGSADLPLHGGRVPHWLGQRMARLGRVLSEAIVHHYGREEFLRRLAHPFWFQAFGAVMGMDWHSSGITTSVVGALKRALAPLEDELGVRVCGGRGTHSRRTPSELLGFGERTGIDGEALASTSRLVAKVDSAAVQDGFDLYLHAFVVAADGRWTVIQQGMNTTRRQARRYHWLSEGLRSFVDEPHAAIAGPHQGRIVNLTDRRAEAARACQLQLLQGNPEHVVAAVLRARKIPAPTAAVLPHLQLPAHHEVLESDVVLRRLHRTLAAAAARAPKDFGELLLTPGLGARTVLALAMAAEVIHATPCRFSDPARFSLALGGKDGHPFPVPLAVYDETIRVLRSAVDRARLGNDDRLLAVRRLDEQARILERAVAGPSLDEFVDRERRRSAGLHGRTVGAGRPPATAPRKRSPASRQLSLF